MLLAAIARGVDKVVYESFTGGAKLSKKDKALSNEEKQEKAVDLVFNEDYENKKAAIKKNVEDSLDKLMDELKDRQMDADLQWFRAKDIPKEVKEYEAPIDFSDLIGDATLSKLNAIFQDLLKRQEDKVDPIRSKFGNIEKEEVDMDAKTLYIKAYIREHQRFSFREKVF